MNAQEMESEFVKAVYVSRDIRLAHPRWLEVWPTLKEEYGLETGLILEISCTYRSPKAQNDIWKRQQEWNLTHEKQIWFTDFDGVKKLSNHNIFPSVAIDVYPHLAGKVMPLWDVDLFEPLGKLADKFNLLWGGTWGGKKKDRPHLEVKM